MLLKHLQINSNILAAVLGNEFVIMSADDFEDKMHELGIDTVPLEAMKRTAVTPPSRSSLMATL